MAVSTNIINDFELTSFNSYPCAPYSGLPKREALVQYARVRGPRPYHGIKHVSGHKFLFYFLNVHWDINSMEQEEIEMRRNGENMLTKQVET